MFHKMFRKMYRAMSRAALAALALAPVAAAPAAAGTEDAFMRASAAEQRIIACLAEYPAASPDIYTPAAACLFAGEEECRAAHSGPDAELECALAVNQAWLTRMDHWGGQLAAGGRLDWAAYEAMATTALNETDMHCNVMLGGRDDDAALMMRLGCQTAGTARIATYLRFLAETWKR